MIAAINSDTLNNWYLIFGVAVAVVAIGDRLWGGKIKQLLRPDSAPAAIGTPVTNDLLRMLMEAMLKSIEASNRNTEALTRLMEAQAQSLHLLRNLSQEVNSHSNVAQERHNTVIDAVRSIHRRG